MGLLSLEAVQLEGVLGSNLTPAAHDQRSGLKRLGLKRFFTVSLFYQLGSDRAILPAI